MCAGSGNGMAKSLLHAASEKYSVSNAVFAIIKGYFSNFFPTYHAQNYMTHGDFRWREGNMNFLVFRSQAVLRCLYHFARGHEIF
jgi:sphingosine kinase